MHLYAETTAELDNHVFYEKPKEVNGERIKRMVDACRRHHTDDYLSYTVRLTVSRMRELLDAGTH